MPQPFDDIVVVDFSSGWPGSIASMIMSDFGAKVIKIEPPNGDPYREFPQFHLWNRGKKSVVVDLNTLSGKNHALKLIEQADVLIESFRPGETDVFGINYDDAKTTNEQLIYCSITAFGPKGPYAHYKPYEGIIAAKVGRYTVFTGQAARTGPHFGVVQVASHGTAMAAVRGIISALIVKLRTGKGQRVETSLMQGITPFDVNNWLMWQMMLKFPERFHDDPQSDPNRHPGVGYQPIRTKDGEWIQMANLIARLFRSSLESMDLGYILKDSRFEKAPLLMPDDREELRDMIIKKGQEKTLNEWMDIFVNGTSDVAAEPFMTTQQGIHHPQVTHNKHIEDVYDPIVGDMKQLGVLVKMSKTPGDIKGPAPYLGEHTDEIINKDIRRNSNFEKDKFEELPAHPLSGFTILDLSTVIAGPLSTSLNFELGIRVIRIETVEGDTMRRNFDGLGANRTQAGAENISIDLKNPEGHKIFMELASKADILVHNMRPGAPERLGIGYEQVREVNPSIIYLYAGGYGDSGPHSHRPAMHPIGGAVIGGAMSQLGNDFLPDKDISMTVDEIKEVARRLGRANETNPDPNSSMVISTGSLLGLLARERFGESQYILSTMLGANAYANADDFFTYEGKPQRTIPDSNGYGIHALYRLYEAKQGWIFLACIFEEEWHLFCKSIGRDDLIHDIRFETPEKRNEHDKDLAEILKEIFVTLNANEWENKLIPLDVACVEVEESGMFNFYSQDPHVEANNFIRPAETLRIGSYWRYSPVVEMSLTPTRVGSGPLRGEHTRTILVEIGYSEEEINELKDKLIVDWEEPSTWQEAGH